MHGHGLPRAAALEDFAPPVAIRRHDQRNRCDSAKNDSAKDEFAGRMSVSLSLGNDPSIVRDSVESVRRG